jgi:phosphoglycolate phosphatase
MKTLIIFDFDGTIADTEDISYEIYKEMTQLYNVPEMDKKTLLEAKKKPLKSRILEQGIPFYLLPKLMSEAQSKVLSYIDQAKPFEGIKDVIKELAKTKNLIIVSSNRKKVIKTFLKQHHLKYFSHIYGGAALFGKAAVIKKAIRKMKVKHQDVCYVGDETRDIEACKTIKVDIISASWGFEDEMLLQSYNQHYTASKPSDILKYVTTLDAL